MRKLKGGSINNNSNVSLIAIIVGVLLFIAGIFYFRPIKNDNHITINNKQSDEQPSYFSRWFPDVYLNPYTPPYGDLSYRHHLHGFNHGPVFNMPTNIGAVSVDTPYRQIGIMTPANGSSNDKILPLMGRPLYSNRNKWNYYTISNQHNNVKLPVKVGGKSALAKHGVNELSNGDTIFVEGHQGDFKITTYDTDMIRYM